MDEFENDLAEMLKDRVAGMPDDYDAPPSIVARARRRRATKVSVLAAVTAIVVVGGAGAIARSGGNGPRRLVTSTSTTSEPGRPAVATVECPVSTQTTGSQPALSVAAPTTEPRVPPAGEPSLLTHFASFAATDDPSYVVLGPETWLCHTTLARDGNVTVLYKPDTRPNVNYTWPTADAAAVVVENNVLWNEPWGAGLACSVFDDPAVVRFMVHVNAGCLDDNPHRTVTRVSAHVATFVDDDGDRGVGWMVLPSSDTANDGRVSVLECRPSTEQISAAECDSIVADFAARVGSESVTPSTPVSTVACPIMYAITPDAPLPAPSLEPRIPRVGVPSALDHLVSYAATTDSRFIVLGPKGWKCEATIAADGQNGLTVYDPASITQQGPYPYAGSISIINDFLWHGGVGSGIACSVFDDPTVVQYMTANFPELLPCPRAGRTVTKVDANESTFVDADGSRGVGWMVLPSGKNTDDGKVSVLTCRPVAPLTADECDTIIADFAARIDAKH